MTARKALVLGATGQQQELQSGDTLSGYVQNLGGAPSVQQGAHSARPAAGNAGAIYIETDTATIWRDNGASWDQLVGSSGASAANPTGTASDTAVNGSASTFMRSDGAPAVQKATTSQFGLVKPDGTSVAIATGVISALLSTLQWSIASGAAASPAAPIIRAPRAGSFTSCIVTTTASDGSVALAFDIKQNGTTIFSVTPSVAGGTASGHSAAYGTMSALTVAAGDLFTLNITGGSASWQVQIELA